MGKGEGVLCGVFCEIGMCYCDGVIDGVVIGFVM